MDAEEGLARLRALGFAEADAAALWAHFDDAERRGKPSHGHARIPWLEGLEGFDPAAEPRCVAGGEGLERWDGGGAVGYLVLGRVVSEQLARPPQGARLVVCERTFPTGMLGHHVRRLAEGGLVAVLTATSPRRLGPPAGGPKLTGTNPLALGIPSSGGAPVVADVSMGAVTWGDVVAGLATEEQLVPFGGEQAHKAFALAVGFQLLVDALVREPGHGAVLLVARPESDPVPALRDLAAGARLPGDS
ncbi:MAG TPA: Ldh family oxidoreductase [Gaiellaceae bacterium]|nr:Ldh family oxidoreductase [Gaiellaceae bacterium]